MNRQYYSIAGCRHIGEVGMRCRLLSHFTECDQGCSGGSLRGRAAVVVPYNFGQSQEQPGLPETTV